MVLPDGGPNADSDRSACETPRFAARPAALLQALPPDTLARTPQQRHQAKGLQHPRVRVRDGANRQRFWLRAADITRQRAMRPLLFRALLSFRPFCNPAGEMAPSLNVSLL